MLALKRTRRRAGLFLAVFGVVLLLAGLSVGLSGYLTAASTAGARAGLADLRGSDGGFRITIPLAKDPAAQDARVRAAVRDAVRADGHPVPMIVTRTVETIDSVELASPSGRPVGAALASVPELPEHAVRVAGVWPTSAAEASMQADAAAELGVRVGDRLTLPGGAPITITATWRVRDSNDPRWLAVAIALTGEADNGVVGWVVIDPSLWPAIQDAGAGQAASSRVDASARWIVRPDAAHTDADQLSAVQSASDEVPDLLLERQPGTTVQELGGLQSALQPIIQNVASAIAAATAPLVIVGLLGLVMLRELARMLEQLRRGENALLRARGAGRARFVVGAGIEAACAAVPGAAGGAAIAAGLLGLRGIAGDVPLLGWAGAALVALIAIALVAGAAGHSSREVSRGSPMRGSGSAVGLSALRTGLGSGRVRSTIGVGAVGLLVLAAVVSVSQFLLYGSPLAPTAGGGVAVDPLAIAAPALAIAAIGLLATAAFPLAARALERMSRRRSDLRSLPLRQLARRSRSALTPILVVAFAVSGLVVGASYAGTWAVSVGQTRAAQVGTDVRVVAPSTLDPSVARPVSGQLASAPGGSTSIQLGDSVGTLIELPTSKLRDVITPVAGAVDPAAFEKQLADRIDRPVIPAAASGITVLFTATPALAVPNLVEVTMVDATGSERVVRGTRVPPAADPAPSDGASSDGASSDGAPSDGAAASTPTSTGTATGTGTFQVALPDGVAPWTVHGIAVATPAFDVGARVSFELRASGGSSAELPLDRSWVPSRTSAQRGAIVALGDHPGFRATLPSEGDRILFQSLPGGTLRVPVVISGGLAHDSGLSVGSHAELTLLTGGGQLPVTVAGVSPVVPGIPSGYGVIADLAAIQDAAMLAELRPISATEWWVSTTHPAEAAAQFVKRSPLGTIAMTQATPPADQVLESARTAIWIAGAAIALLAMLAVTAGLLAELRARRQEVDILRALGVPPQEQARDRTIEWGALLGLGVVAGLLDGFVVCGILVPGLARMAVPEAIDALRTSFRVDPIGGLVELVLVASILVGLLAVVFVTVRGQARAAAASEGTDSR